MGIYNIYTFGEVPMLWNLLNAIASYFTVQNITGPVIRIGGMVGLIYVLYRAMSHEITPAEIGSLFVRWGILCFLIYIPTTVWVYNVYSGVTQKVDNVPLIISGPISLSTTASWNVLQSLDGAFQSTSGSYLTVNQNGLLGPLEILLALRNNGFIQKVDPYLMASLQTIVADCSQQGTIVRGSSTLAVDNSTNLLQYLETNLRQTGITLWYNEYNPQGAVITCSQAGPMLTSAFAIFINSPKFGALLKASVSKDSAPYGTLTFNKYQTVYDSLTGLSTSALEGAMNSMVAGTIDYTLSCLSNLSQITNSQACTHAGIINTDTSDAYNSDAAQNASFFAKTIFTSMGVLQFLFFAISPMVLFILMIFPMHGPKIFLSYLMFGAWVGSWLVFAAPMNYFIQYQVVDVIQSIAGPAGGYTMANMPALYTALAAKLAFASNVMAATPLISMAIIAGSMLSLNSLANKWSSEGHSKTDGVGPRLVSSGAMMQNSPGAQGNTNLGYSEITGNAKQTGSLSLMTANSTGIGKTFSKAEASATGDSLTYTNSTGDRTTVTASDVQSYKQSMQNSEASAFEASGVALSKMYEKDSRLHQNVAAQAKTLGLSKDRMDIGLQASSLERLSAKDSNFAAKLAGTYNDGGKLTPAQTLAQQQKAQSDLSFEMKKVASTTDGLAAAATIASGLIPSAAGGAAFSSAIGKAGLAWKSQVTSTYASDRGLSKSTASALEHANTTARASQDGHSLSWSAGESFNLQTTSTGTSARSVEMTPEAYINYTRGTDAGREQLRIDTEKALRMKNAPAGSAENKAWEEAKSKTTISDGGSNIYTDAFIGNYADVILKGNNNVTSGMSGASIQSQVTGMNAQNAVTAGRATRHTNGGAGQFNAEQQGAANNIGANVVNPVVRSSGVI